MKQKIIKIFESIGYLLALGFGFYILYFGFKMMWIFLQSILK